MPNLQDGETVEMKGSGRLPYILKNTGGVYSCSCPAWRNQSVPIERRSCKHLRRLRGDSAEVARIGAALPAAPRAASSEAQAPPLLLAETWSPDTDPTGWLMSEKLDGVRAYWTGKLFLSRLGHVYHAPDWFVAGLPDVPLDGELWLGRKQFQRAVSIVRRQDKSDLWREIQFVVFDAPAVEGDFESRLRVVEDLVRHCGLTYAIAHPHVPCNGRDHLNQELDRVEALGGEGLMLRQPGSTYAAGRSTTLLKVKRFQDAEARVIGHEAGKGRHKGRLGALLVEMAGGVKFAVGTGFSDAERGDPPPIGSMITFRYQELSDGGVPRFPSYVGIRRDESSPVIPKQEETIMPVARSSSVRRLEFVEGNSSKFWELTLDGKDVTVNFGRIGTAGQSNIKSFPDAAAALKHAEKLTSEKLKKGYKEVTR